MQSSSDAVPCFPLSDNSDTVGYKKSQIPDLHNALRMARAAAFNALADEGGRALKSERAIFVENIKKQKFKSFKKYPLSKRYLATKKRKNRDLRTMIATRTYVNSIRIFSKKTGTKKLMLRIGFHPRMLARNLDGRTTPITLDRVAKIQEAGSKKINLPPRPHWKPQTKDFRERIVKMRPGIRDRVAAVARKAFLSYLSKRAK